MALLGNYTVLAKNPGRAFSGSTVSDNRSQWNKSGANRCRFVGWAEYDSLSSTPDGYRPPYSWVIAIDGGGMSTWGQIIGTGTLDGSAAGGRNGEAALVGTGDFTATMQLIVSAVASITGTGTLDGNLLAVLLAVAELTGTGDFTITGAEGIGSLAGGLTGTGTLTVPNYGTGELAAEIQPFTELSPQSLAQAVWAALRDDNTDPASMGEAVRLVHAILRNRTVTDPAAGTFTVYDDDDNVLLAGDLWEDAAGSLPYDGNGAERRDRLT